MLYILLRSFKFLQLGAYKDTTGKNHFNLKQIRSKLQPKGRTGDV